MKRCTLVLAAMLYIPLASAQPTVVSSGATSYFVPLSIGKSIVIDLPAEASDVLVGNPKVAGVVLRTRQRAYITAGDVGQTSVYFFDANRRPIASLDIGVAKDAREIQGPLLPHSVAAGYIVEVYRGPVHSSVLCGVAKCTPEPVKDPPPGTTAVTESTTTLTGGGATQLRSTTITTRN